MEKESTLTSKGQVTLPADIRRILRLERGDKVVFTAEGDTVTLHRAPKATSFTAYAGRYREGTGKTRETINAELRELRGK
ncbi:hypothetical protein BH24DEI2_BH24DEI2_09580 [soil metagenome]